MSKIYIDKQNGALYDWNGENLTKVLPYFEGNMTIPSFITTPFEMNENYRKATKKDIRKFRLTYYNDKGVKCLYKYNLKKSNLIFLKSIKCMYDRYKYNNKECEVVDFDAEKLKYEVIE